MRAPRSLRLAQWPLHTRPHTRRAGARRGSSLLPSLPSAEETCASGPPDRGAPGPSETSLHCYCDCPTAHRHGRVTTLILHPVLTPSPITPLPPSLPLTQHDTGRVHDSTLHSSSFLSPHHSPLITLPPSHSSSSRPSARSQSHGVLLSSRRVQADRIVPSINRAK